MKKSKKTKAWTIAIRIKDYWYPIISYCASTRAGAVHLFNDNIVPDGQYESLADFDNYKPVKILIEVLK